MSLKLYWAPGACSFVPHVLLEVAGEPYEQQMVKLHRNEQDSPQYRAINPRGQVPVLVDGAHLITQILAIVSHLDERHPQLGFLPKAGLARTRVLERLAWMNNTMHTTFTHVFMPYKFVDTPQGQEQVKQFNQGVYRGLLQELEAWAQGQLGSGQPWLGGDRIGPLDAYALTLMRWGGMAGTDPTTLPTLWAQASRLAQQEPVARVIERERLQLNLYKP